MAARLRLLVPEETRNYITNPAARFDTTGATAVGSTVTRTLDYARFGVASFKVVTNGLALKEGFYYRVSSLSGIQDIVTVSAYVRGSGDLRIRLIDNPNGPEWASLPIVLETDRWQRIEVTGRSRGSNDMRLYIETDVHAQAVTFYADGLQMERQEEATTYCDGDQAGCRWTLLAHGSQSVRSPYTRAGGRWVTIAGPSCEKQNLYMTVVGGLGVAPIQNQTQPYADAPGDYFQNVKTLSRPITLSFHAKKNYRPRIGKLPSLKALHQLRQQLLDLVKPDRTKGSEAFTLEYQDGEIPLYLNVRYDGGMEGEWDVRNSFVQSFPLRLLAVSPYFTEDDQESAELRYRTRQTVNYALQRVNGVWSDMNGGFDGQVLAFTVGPRGQVIAVGSFTHANHKAGAVNQDIFANNIAWWDGEKWNQYGSGANNTVRAVAIAPNGDTYFVGDFTQLNGVACNRVGYIDTSGVAHALGTGLNGPAYAVKIDPDGHAWIGGNFTSAGGVTAYYATHWDGAFHPLGSSNGLNGIVYSIDITRDGSQVYLGGAFTDEQGNPAILSLNYIALFEPLFNAFDDLGVGFDALVRKVLVTDAGRVYAAGDFTESNDSALVLLYLAYWNGASWFEVGVGADNTVRDLAVSRLGNILLGGDFTRAGSADAIYAALWNGSAYVNLDIDLENQVYAVALDGDENMFLAPNGAMADFAAITNVTNIGSAETSPILYVTGPCTLAWIENQTTQKRVYTNLVIAINEEITIDFSQGTVASNVRGNLAWAINPGSDLRAWTLIPGENRIAMLMTDDVAGASAHLYYTPRHWSADSSPRVESL